MKRLLNWKLLLLLIVLLAAFLRFYELGNIPAGLLNDEANKGYDTYSLLLTGKDQWGSFLPLTNLRGFGDYPPPVYHYLSIIPVLLFGLNAFSIRFISALAGVFSVFLMYLLGKKLFNERVGIFSALSLAIFPWAIGLSRVAVEVNVAIALLLTALIFGLKNPEGKKKRNLIISAAILALSIYTYSAFILFAPIVFIVIIYENYYNQKLNFKFLFIPILIFLFLVLPNFIKKDSASVRFSQVGLTTNINSIGLIDTLNMQRGQCLKFFNPLICKIIENKVALYSSVFAKNYLSHFSFNFLYVSGTVTQFSILEQRGLDYIFDILFLLLGVYFLIRLNKNPKINFVVIGLLLFSALPDSVTGDGNYTRAAIMIPFVGLVNGLGMSYFIDFINRIKNKYINFGVYSLTAIIVLFSVTTFFITYLTYFNNNYSIYSQYGYKDLMNNVYGNKSNYNKIYISRHLNDAKQYIYYLFYTKYSPVSYQQKINVDYSVEAGGWVSINRIGNLYFVQNPPSNKDLSKMTDTNKILIVSNPIDFPKNVKPVFVVKDKLGNVIFKAVRASDLLEYEKSQEQLNLNKI